MRGRGKKREERDGFGHGHQNRPGRGSGSGEGGGGGRGRGIHRHLRDHQGHRLSRAERGERTREEILEAAAELFARHGFDGVSMRDLAEASEASQPLLHFHFGRKRDLYEAVQDHLQKEYSGAVADALDDDTSGLEFFLKGLSSRIQYTVDHPERARMMLWEQLEGQEVEAPSAKRLRETVLQRVEQAKNEDLIRENVRVPMLAAIIAGAVQFWPLVRERYGAMLPRGERRHVDDWYIDEVLGLMIYGAGTDALRQQFEEWRKGEVKDVTNSGRGDE